MASQFLQAFDQPFHRDSRRAHSLLAKRETHTVSICVTSLFIR